MSFELSSKHLSRLCKINSFPVPKKRMVFFGLRGCLPIDVDNQEFKKKHQLSVSATDYTHPKCTLGQWLPSEGLLAIFPGSTIPHIRHVKSAQRRDGVGTNQLMTGYYDDYRKGVHKASSKTGTGHEAFRQTKGRPIRRSADDFDFDADDRVEVVNPFDNLHSAWCPGVNHDRYASAGCQVVVGFPKCKKLGNKPDSGPWKIFKENAYKLEQNSFPYMLLTGNDAQSVALNNETKVPAKLRFGSNSTLVSKVQKSLQDLGFYEGNIDKDFGQRTTRALLEFQEDVFGPDSDDGIVSSMTASALGMDWPKV